jgi:hypothetical protein
MAMARIPEYFSKSDSLAASKAPAKKFHGGMVGGRLHGKPFRRFNPLANSV